MSMCLSLLPSSPHKRAALCALALGLLGLSTSSTAEAQTDWQRPLLGRHKYDFSLDSTFGTNGATMNNPTAQAERITAATRAPDGKIVVAGWVYSSSDETSKYMFVAKYTVDGAPDGSFGLWGWRAINFTESTNEYANDVYCGSDGKITVVGTATVNGDAQIAVARMLSNGLPDTTFHEDGLVLTDFASREDEYGDSVQVSSQGKIVVSGRTQQPRSDGTIDHELAVVRYLSNGNLDTSFDGDGKVLVDFGAASDKPRPARAMTPVGSTKIVVAGDVGGRLFALRLNDNGALDTTFGSFFGGAGGVSYIDVPDMVVTASDARLDSDGKIVLAGRAREPGYPYHYTLARFTSNGFKDTTFAGGGVMMTNLNHGSYAHGLTSLSFGPQGQIVCSGSYGNGTNDMILMALFQPNGTVIGSFHKWHSASDAEHPAYAFWDEADRFVVIGYGYRADGY